MIKFKVDRPSKPKLLINVGALFDVPTGVVVTGARGESIINGGLSSLTGIVGAGNTYKSSLIHYFALSAADRMAYTHETAIHTYDTEVNVNLSRLNNLASGFKSLSDDIALNEDKEWIVTDKSEYAADEWVTLLKDSIKEKSKGTMVEFNAFRDPITKKPLKALLPTFVEVDSLSEFEAGTTMELLDKTKTDDGSTNTLFMKQGLYKTKFISELPRLSNSSNTNFLLTAHVGEKINMASGPAMYNMPTKKLQFLKQGDAIKGVSSKFFFLMTSAWMAHTATVLRNQTTKLPEYPLTSDDTNAEELNLVRLTQLRSKSGASGYTLELVVSQNEGLLPALTEFNHVKNNNRFGLNGTLKHYSLDLCPDVKLSRTTVRTKLDNDSKLRRAVNITSELLQFQKFHPNLTSDGLMCTPKELYDSIIELGYDWDILLNSRGWWSIDNYNTVLPFLSTVDLLRMRAGLYVPFWYDKSKLKIKEKSDAA